MVKNSRRSGKNLHLIIQDCEFSLNSFKLSDVNPLTLALICRFGVILV